MKMIRLYLCTMCALSIISGASIAGAKAPLIGESEKVYTLSPQNKEIRGLAFDDISPEAPRLFVLDRSGKIFIYQLNQDKRTNTDELKLLNTYDLPKEGDTPIKNPRGLAYALDNDQSILYFLNWDNSSKEIKSQLWRCDFMSNTFTDVNLNWYSYRIGDREVLDLAVDDGKILICFDSSGYKDNNLRVARGIIQLKWNRGYDGKLERQWRALGAGER